MKISQAVRMVCIKPKSFFPGTCPLKRLNASQKHWTKVESCQSLPLKNIAVISHAAAVLGWIFQLAGSVVAPS
jgi:hypothetical protein